MTDLHSGKRVRIPVKYIDGKWELSYGGPLPITNGANASLTLDRNEINDPEFLEKLERKSEHEILPPGTELLVALRVKPESNIAAQLRAHLIPFPEIASHLRGDFYMESSYFHFVRIKVLPQPIQRRFLKELRAMEYSISGIF
jgi:hypothetical protein